MAVTLWLIDKSALLRLGDSTEADEWANRIDRGLVRISTVTRLEMGFSARSADELTEIVAWLDRMPSEYLTPTIEQRSIEVQGLLAARGQHRAPSVPDLLIAATAELAGLSVLHVDKDFELIADLTGQPVHRL